MLRWTIQYTKECKPDAYSNFSLKIENNALLNKKLNKWAELHMKFSQGLLKGAKQQNSLWREVEIHPKAFRLTLFRGYRQNEVEILPNWFIYRKEEISLVKAVANKKGFRR